MWVFATLVLVSTISDTSGTGKKSLDIVKEGVHALSYIPGLLPTIGGTSSDGSNDDAQAGSTRGLHTVIEKNRALKAASDDDTKKDDASGAGVGAGGGGADAKDLASAPDDDLGPTILDHMEASNKTSILPPEPEEQPREWPATVLVIFLVLAAALLVITGVRNCRKKREYTEVPATSLIV